MLRITLYGHRVVYASGHLNATFNFSHSTGTVVFKRIDNVDASSPKYYSHVHDKEGYYSTMMPAIHMRLAGDV
jgi:hypothetical protein